MALAGIAFIIGALVSLVTSWVLVTRLERVGERLGLSEALLGIVAAPAADAPEITSGISALAQAQRTIGVGRRAGWFIIAGYGVFVECLLGISWRLPGLVHQLTRSTY